VKKKLLYVSLDDDARAWMRSINEENIVDWEGMKKAFISNIILQLKLNYHDRGFIYNFWLHPEESIAQAWGRFVFARILVMETPFIS
jgi:hypothetical protein